MAAQTYANHVHRPVAAGLGYVFWAAGVVGLTLRGFAIGGRWSSGFGLAGLALAILMLLVISRTYITRLQDRIIKLEMRLRVASLAGVEQQQALMRLDSKRIAALRFASDEELPSLLDRVVRESLKPDEIKRAIRHWVPDLDRT
jgi:uncharacterized protein DUF6526